MPHSIGRPVLALAIAAVAVSSGLIHAQRAVREQHVLVAAVGKNDAPVSGLTPADLVVREDGVAREVIRVTKAETPMQLVLLVDDSQAMRPLLPELRQALHATVTTILADNAASEISVVTFGERSVVVEDFTSNPLLLKAAVDKVFPRAGAGATALEALIETAARFRKKGAPRAAVLMFVADEGPEFSSDSHVNVMAGLKSARASLWTIVLSDRSSLTLSNERRERAQVIGDGATTSGGGTRTIVSQQGLQAAFAAFAGLLTSQYDVTYGRPESMIPPEKREVTTKRSGVKIWASRWAGQ